MLPALLGLGANLLGGLFGQSESSDARNAAMQASQQAMEYLQRVGIPSVDAQQILLSNPEFVSQFMPENQTAEQLGPSAMGAIATDPRLKEAQMQALASLQEQGTSPLTATEQAQLNKSRRDVAQEAQARQGQILQDLAARGQGGSGAELAARLSASQNAAQRAGEASDQTMAMAQQRALQAIANAGSLGGQMQGTEFSQKAQQASAADAIAKFNAANAQQVQASNVAARNTASQKAADTRQQLEQQRAINTNYQQEYNKKLLQQQYQNQMQKATAISGQANKDASQLNQQAGQTAQNWANIGSGVAQGIGAISAAQKAEEDKKKTVIGSSLP